MPGASSRTPDPLNIAPPSTSDNSGGTDELDERQPGESSNSGREERVFYSKDTGNKFIQQVRADTEAQISNLERKLMEKIETLLLLNARPPTRAASMASLLDEDHEEQHAPFNGGGIPPTTIPTGLRPQNRNDLRSTTPASTSAPGFGNPGMPGRWSAKPPPPFKGKDGENVLS